MNVQEIIEQFRRQVDDTAQPYLWSDAEVMLYLVDAQDQFVRAVGGIADVTAAAGDPDEVLLDLALTPGQPFTAFSPYILRVRSARLLTARQDITIASEADLKLSRVRDYGLWPTLSFDDEDQGPVELGVLGVKENHVRWVHVPESADTARLHVQRLPYPRLTDEDGPELEINPDHHLSLVDWMKYRAYSKQDAEVYDKVKADDCKREFVGYADQARKQRERQQYKPRTVQYGGI